MTTVGGGGAASRVEIEGPELLLLGLAAGLAAVTEAVLTMEGEVGVVVEVDSGCEGEVLAAEGEWELEADSGCEGEVEAAAAFLRLLMAWIFCHSTLRSCRARA